jgi:hypothetical protein
LSDTVPQKKKEQPNLGSAIVANIFFPGLGSWQLGSKKRGAIIMAIMVLSVVMAAYSYVSSLSSQIDAALDIANDTAFEESFNSTGNFIWVGIAALTFCYSFIDLYIVFRKDALIPPAIHKR